MDNTEMLEPADDTVVIPDNETIEEQPETLDQLLAQKDKALKLADEAFALIRQGKKFNRGDVVKALINYRTVVAIQEKLSNLIIQDLMIVDERFKVLERQMFQSIQQASTLATTLLNKKVVTQEEIRETWEKEVKPQLEAKIKAAEQETEGTPSTLASESPETTTEIT